MSLEGKKEFLKKWYGEVMEKPVHRHFLLSESNVNSESQQKIVRRQYNVAQQLIPLAPHFWEHPLVVP